MVDQNHAYVVVGGGVAAAAAIEGIREHDRDGSVLLAGSESHLPYDRPPLTKQLWFGKKQPADIVVHDAAFYASQGVELALGAPVMTIDRASRRVRDAHGNEYGYGKLLLCTGGTPRRLGIPGADDERIYYYRTLDDYTSLRARARPGSSALVIGGGFIGSELAAALRQTDVRVTLLYPDDRLCAKVFPEPLARSVEAAYRDRGIRIVSRDRPAAIVRRGEGFVTRTAAGQELASDLVVVGIGIAPAVELADRAGLTVDDGIVVDELLRTADPDVYAAGDAASFPYLALGRRMRVEHWDNAREQGRQAGRNMAGAHGAYEHMPYFFSDLFDLGYEAVGEVDARLATTAEWERENEKGILYYTRDDRVRGMMMCNVWGQVDRARELVRGGARLRPTATRRGPAQPSP